MPGPGFTELVSTRAKPEQRGAKASDRHTDLMESLNLNALAGSLPTSNLASAEKELLNNFRGDFPFFLLVPSPSRSFLLRRSTTDCIVFSPSKRLH